jgi:predicted nucleotidyltransferase
MTLTKSAVIDNIKDRILSNVKPKSIILFGSSAKDIDREDSDIDILVVWDELQDTPNIRRRIMLRKIIGITEMPVDIITCTSDELKAAMEDKNSFTSKIIMEGKVLYGRLN